MITRMSNSLKRIISALLILILMLSSSGLWSVKVYAKENAEAKFPFYNVGFPNGGGYWSSEWFGMRFSLIDKYGETKNVVDAFAFEDYSGVKQNVYKASGIGAVGTIGTILSGGGLTSADYMVFRAFHKSKIEIAKKQIDDLINSCSYSIPIVNSSNYDSYDRKNSQWYCADARTIFKHIPNNGVNEYSNGSGNNYRLFDLYFDSSEKMWAQTDAIDEFICNKLTGKKRKTLDTDTFNPDSDAWVGMCDLLYSFGLGVYVGVDPNNLGDNQSKWKIYNNLIKEFVEPEYCVVVEPIMFIAVPLCTYEMVSLPSGGIDYNIIDKRVAIYYGSMTELGLLESQNWVHNDDRGAISKGLVRYEDGYDYVLKDDFDTQREFHTLHDGAVSRGIGQQCAWVTEDYKFELEKYAGEGVLNTVNVDNYIEWRKFRSEYNNSPYYIGGSQNDSIDTSKIYENPYESTTSQFTAYTTDVLKNYATGMALIVSSDFIKPQIETYDSEYRTDTNVVTSLKVSNRSDTNYTTILSSTAIDSNTTKNNNNVPKAMLCKFTVSKITDDDGEVGRWTADRSDITNQFKQKVEELGFAKDESGNNITEFYGSLDGLLPREITNANAPCYVSFNWKTPKEPCKVTFEVEFLNANSNPEPVLGTDEHDGLRATEMDEDMRNIYGKYITYFDCDIAEGENTTYFTEATVPPDSVSIISVAPNAAEGTEEQKLYKLNHDIYDAYQAAHGTTPAVYTGTDFAGKTIVDSQSWSEYVASYDASNNIVLTHKPHNVSIGLSKTTDDIYTDSTTKILRTDQSGLYSDYADTIGSGYGIGVDFISSYSNDEAGVDYIRDLTVNGVTYQNSLVTNYDHGVVMFPEYNYQTYYGELLQFDTDVDLGGRSAEKRFMFTANKDSKFYGDAVDRPAGMSDEEYAEYAEMNRDEKSRVHFTPVWYPDGKYQIVMCMFDAWTPAGELWFYTTYDIEIKGSIYDTWYITRTYKNQVAS